MKKLSLALIAAFFQVLSSFAQTDSGVYKQRKLRIDEVTLVSGYYTQNGNNSAVTGGIGTEQLTDFANTLELRLAKTDRRGRLHNYAVEIGIDHYSSASSDKIDPSTVSSASHADTRIYPTLSYGITNDAKGLSLGASLSYSTEFDYHSMGVGANMAKTSKDHNTEASLKLQAYFDNWVVIYPIELRPGNGNQYSGHDGDHQTSPRNSYSISSSVSRVINRRLEAALLIDGVYQSGLLATKYQRVYFTDNSERVENLPDHRLKLPLGVRTSCFLGDRYILRGFYRFYIDDWGISGHTASLEVPIKLSAFTSVTPFYRYYIQTTANYFAPYKAHLPTDVFYTSDYDLSAFQSQFFGAGIRLSPERGIFGWSRFSILEIRYGHYLRTTGLHSDIISLNARFK
jgi:hypothetical protein